MITIVLIFLVTATATAIIVVVSHSHSFKKYYTIQGLHKMLKSYYYYYYNNSTDDDDDDAGKVGDCCAVCLCQLQDYSVSEGGNSNKLVRSLPGCYHSFHADCIGAWLNSHNSCPLCRNQILPCSTASTSNPPKHYSHLIITHLFHSFSDLMITLLYMALPPTIRDTFPLVR